MPSIGSNLGSLFVHLGLKSDDLEKGSDKAKRSLKGVRAEMRELVNQSGKVAVSVGAVGAALVVAMVDRAGQAAREIKNLSQVSNASTREFQRNAAAARTVGIEAEKLADIYKDMSDRVGDFMQTGAGPLADFFEKIAPQVGVTADQFARLSGPEALQLYVDSLERANLAQSDMTFYMEAIAGDSTRLLPLLRNNGTAMRELGDEAERAGQILSDINLDKLNEAKNAIDNLKASMETTAAVAVSTFAPPLEAIANELNNILAEAFERSGEDALSWGETLGNIFAFAADAAYAATKTIGSTFEAMGKQIGGRLAQLGALLHGDMESVLNTQLEMWREQGEIWDDLANTDMRRFRDALLEVRQAHEDRRLAAEAANEAERRITGVAVGAAGEGSDGPQTVSVSTSGGVDALGQGADRAGARAEQARAELEVVRDYLSSEAELEQEQYEHRMEVLRENLELRLVTKEEYALLEQDIEQAHQDEMSRIAKQGAEDQLHWAQMTGKQKVSMISGLAGQVFSTLKSANSRQFEENKKLARAEVLINTSSAAIKSFNNAGGYPWGIAPAALMIAQGAAQLSAINSTSIGGGGGAVGGTAGGAAGGSGGGAAGAGAGGGQVIAIEGLDPGSMFSGKAVRQLVEAINENAKDGGRVVFT